MPGTRRGRDLAEQRRDDARGRFYERVLTYKAGQLDPDSSATVRFDVPSLGGRHVRMVAMRGVVEAAGIIDQSTGPYDDAFVRVRLYVNTLDLIVVANSGPPPLPPKNSASFRTLFGDPKIAPWYWFGDPPRLRTGDVLVAEFANTNEGKAFRPQLSIRFTDDQWWTEAYARDRVAEEDWAERNFYATLAAEGGTRE